MTGDRIPEAVLDRARGEIVNVVKGYIPELKKSGKDWVARCPFHSERSPSFGVSESKEFYYCHGCGAGGDAIKFVQEMNPGITFRDAVRSILGEFDLESSQARPLKPAVRAVRCDLPGHAEDREKAEEVLSRCEYSPTHKYLLKNNTAPQIGCFILKGSLIVPLINNIGEVVNVAAMKADGSVSYAAGRPSFGSTAEIISEGKHDGKTIICIDYAHAWRIWWAQRGKSRVLACMDADNFRWMLTNCKDRFTHVGCDPSEADEHIDYGRGVVAIPLDPYGKIDRAQLTA